MRSNWIARKLADIADITMGQSPKSEFYNSNKVGMPFLQGNRTFGHRYPVFDTYTTNPTKIAKAGDVIMSVRAPVGDLNFTPVDMCLGRGVCGIRMKNGNQDFLFYLLKFLMPQLVNKESGTVFGSVNRNDIEKLDVCIPEDENEQKTISRYLAMLDEKITNNEEINDNLLQQAQAIFKHTFKDNASTTPATIADIALNVTDGVHNTIKDDPEGQYLLLSCKNIKGGSLNIGPSERRINSETFEKLRRRTKLAKGDILISSVGTVGELLMLNTDPTNYEFQRSVAIVKPDPKIVSSAYVYESLVSKKTELINVAHGAVQQCLFISDIAGFPIGIPRHETLRSFDEIVTPMFDTISANEAENTRLESLRNALLPRLMSGELDVSDVVL